MKTLHSDHDRAAGAAADTYETGENMCDDTSQGLDSSLHRTLLLGKGSRQFSATSILGSSLGHFQNEVEAQCRARSGWGKETVIELPKFLGLGVRTSEGRERLRRGPRRQRSSHSWQNPKLSKTLEASQKTAAGGQGLMGILTSQGGEMLELRPSWRERP